MALYPVNLDVEGKLCLVVGGGRVALGKVKELLRCGAEVKVVAPSICDELSEFAEGFAAPPSDTETVPLDSEPSLSGLPAQPTASFDSEPPLSDLPAQPTAPLDSEPSLSDSPAPPTAPLQLLRRQYAASDLDGCLIAIAATGDSAVNRQVFQDGHRQGVLVNSADDPQNCHFTLPSRLRREDLLITISTEGRSPAMASWLRQQIEASLDDNIDQMLHLVAEVRAEIQAQGIPTEPLDWTTALNNGILDLIKAGNPAEAKARLRTSLGIPSPPKSQRPPGSISNTTGSARS